jgi:hypothetical protein
LDDARRKVIFRINDRNPDIPTVRADLDIEGIWINPHRIAASKNMPAEAHFFGNGLAVNTSICTPISTIFLKVLPFSIL